jgi:hypothetical protein
VFEAVQVLVVLQLLGVAPTVMLVTTGLGVFTVPPEQAPAWQDSPSVHPSLSLQVVPSSASGFEHWPVAGSQLPATEH